MVSQRLHHFRIGNLQQPRALLHDNHAHAQRREHARVLHHDDAAAHHNQRFRQLWHAQDLVAINNVAAVDGHFWIGSRLGARGDYYELGLEFSVAVAVLHANVVRVQKLPRTVDQIDAVALELVLDDPYFILHHMLDAEVQVRHGHFAFVAVVGPVEILVVEPGEMQHRLAHGLAGDCAGIYAHAAD